MCVAQSTYGLKLIATGLISWQRKGSPCCERGQAMVKLVLYQVLFTYLLHLLPFLTQEFFSLPLILGVKAPSRVLKLAATFKTIWLRLIFCMCVGMLHLGPCWNGWLTPSLQSNISCCFITVWMYGASTSMLIRPSKVSMRPSRPPTQVYITMYYS